MPQLHRDVGIVVERRNVDSPWIDHAWAPVAVLPDAPDLATWTPLGGEPGRARFYLGPAVLTLHSVDTAHFRENFEAGAPMLWVAVRPTGIEPALDFVGVTADPFEGEVFSENPGDIVEAVAMPASVAAEIAAFYAAHHVEQVFVKRQRKEYDPRKGGAPRPEPGGAPSRPSGDRS